MLAQTRYINVPPSRITRFQVGKLLTDTQTTDLALPPRFAWRVLDVIASTEGQWLYGKPQNDGPGIVVRQA